MATAPAPVLIDHALPWERQFKETSPAYGAFSVYRDLGAGRTLRDTRQKLGKSKALIDGWYTTWSWSERARSYDNHLTREATKEAAKAVKEMATRHIAIATQLQIKAVEGLKSLPPSTLTARDVVALAKLGIDIERINRGEPTELTGTVLSQGESAVRDAVAELTVEEAREALAALRKGDG